VIVLITNDDGIEAEGLAKLRDAVAQQFPAAEIYTVAPAEPMSQVGHRVTTHEPISFERRGERDWAVRGTPADCVRVALFSLLPVRVDWVFSGINHGGNLGQDRFISGTLAAAREAAYHGVAAAGVSQYVRQGVPLDWDRARGWVRRVLEQVVEQEHRDGQYWNVNLPHLDAGAPEPELVEAAPERAALPVVFGAGESELHYRAQYSERPSSEGSDVAVCFGGHVSVTRLEIQSG